MSGRSKPSLGETQLLGSEARLASCLGRLVERLAFATALERDPILRAAIAETTPLGPCALAFGPAGPFLGLSDGRLTDHGTLAGDAPPNVAVVDLAKALAQSSALARTVGDRLRESGAQSDAERLVLALQSDAHAYTLDGFRQLSRWAVLLASEAYMHTVVTQIVLDETRALVRTRPSEKVLRRRWDQIHSLSHSTLIATSAAASTWLVEMAGAFEWQTWTPSFALVRERVHRLAMRGAWAAARFGPSVVDRYLRVVVEGEHPLHCFDAVLGTTAIALAWPGDASAIVSRLEHALRARIARTPDANDRLLAETCLRSVHVAVNEPSLAEEKTLQRGRSRAPPPALGGVERHMGALFLALDDESDCARIDESGLMPAILALPSVAPASAEVFFHASSVHPYQSDSVWCVTRARGVFSRSINLGLCACGSGKAAQDCCAN